MKNRTNIQAERLWPGIKFTYALLLTFIISSSFLLTSCKNESGVPLWLLASLGHGGKNTGDGGNDSLTTPEDTPLVIDLNGLAGSGQGQQYTVVLSADLSSDVGSGSAGALYQAGPDEKPGAPIAVGDTIVGGRLIYVLFENKAATGPDFLMVNPSFDVTFSETGCTGTGCADPQTVTLPLTVNPVNDPPVVIKSITCPDMDLTVAATGALAPLVAFEPKPAVHDVPFTSLTDGQSQCAFTYAVRETASGLESGEKSVKLLAVQPIGAISPKLMGDSNDCFCE